MLYKKFEHWHPDWELDSIWLRRKPSRFQNPKTMLLQNNLNGQPLIFLDYNCYPDTIIFSTEVVLDYRYSHTHYRDSLSFQYLKNYLEIARAHANVLEQDLRDFHARHCPRRKQVYKRLDKTIRRMDRHLNKYHRKTQKNRSWEDLRLWEQEIKDLQKRSKMPMGRKI